MNDESPPPGLPPFFEPICSLGEGGMGAVWSVLDTRTGKIGALKAIRPSLLLDKAIIPRFEREMRTIAKLDHPGIVQALDVGRLSNNAPYLLMEQVDGVPMTDLRLQDRSLSALIRLFDRILAALSYAHARQIIHRDLKPDNILIITNEYGELFPKLMDFGLAMVAVRGEVSTRLTARGMVVGTPAYMAPEQACDEHHKIGPATDLYAFGCMLYELLCGVPPHNATSPIGLLLAHATKEPLPFKALPDIPSANKLAPLVMRLLAKDPLDRFELAADARIALRQSGLMNNQETFQSDPLGPFGDTILGIPIPDNIGLLTTSDSPIVEPLTQLTSALSLENLTINPPEHVYLHINIPEASMRQISVLSLRPPPLIARSHELNLLRQYLEDVRTADQGALSLISAPLGAGKTHLIRNFVEEGEARGALRYLHVPMNRSPSASLAILQSFSDHLQLHTTTPAQTESALMRFFGTEDDEDWRVIGFLEHLQTQKKDAHPRQTPNTNFLNLLLHTAIEHFTQTRPLILWLDETQRTPNEQICKFIETFFTRQKTHPHPVLLIVAERSEMELPSDLELEIGKNETAWRRPGIHLSLLSHPEMLDLIHNGLKLSEKLAQHIAKFANGSPLLALSMARSWHAEGLLQYTANGFDYRGDESLLPIPEATQQLFSSQLEFAFQEFEDNTWHPIAQLAAIMGETFSLEQLQRGTSKIPTLQTLIDVDQFLERALHFGIIRNSLSEENLFAFSNSMIHSNLLTHIPPKLTRDLHHATALAKLEVGANTLEARLEIAQHHLTSHHFALAVDSFTLIAQELIYQTRFDEAFQILDAAQQAIASEQDVAGPWDRRMPFIWEMELEILLSQEDLQGAQLRVNWILTAASTLKDPCWDARMWHAQGRLMQYKKETEAALNCFERSINIFRLTPPKEDQTHCPGGRCLEEGCLKEHRLQLGLALVSYSECLALIDTPVATQCYVTEALEIANDLSDSHLLTRTLTLQGIILTLQNDPQGAQEQFDRAQHHARAIGDLRSNASIHRALADLAIAEENFLQAERHLKHASQCYEARGDFQGIAACHQQFANIARHQGRTTEATQHERWINLLGV